MAKKTGPNRMIRGVRTYPIQTYEPIKRKSKLKSKEAKRIAEAFGSALRKR